MQEWNYPETWLVGDSLDEETMNRRIRDQNEILLRRPLLVVHHTSDQSISSGGNQALSFNTIDQDDDGMALEATPLTDFYPQRTGTYQFWYTITVAGNGTAGTTLGNAVRIDGTKLWDIQTTTALTSGDYFCHSSTGTVFVNAGEYFDFSLYQNTGANMTVKAVGNTPRLAVMWLGVS